MSAPSRRTAPGTFLSPLSRPRARPQLSQKLSDHQTTPKSRPVPMYAPPPGVRNPQVPATPKTRHMLPSHAPRTPSCPPHQVALGVHPLPRPSLVDTKGLRAVRPQERPSCHRRKCDVSQA